MSSSKKQIIFQFTNKQLIYLKIHLPNNMSPLREQII